MRNKFTEWINAGVARAFYQPDRVHVDRALEPFTAAMISTYNNIWGMPTDTQMSKLSDGRLVITGRFVNSNDWGDFVQSSHWFAVDFTHAGVWNLECWLSGFNKTLIRDVCGAEPCWKVVDFVEPENPMVAVSVTTSESKMPNFINFLEHQPGSIQDILDRGGDHTEIAASLNESLKVKGNTWYMIQEKEEYKLGVRLGETNYFVKLNKK